MENSKKNVVVLHNFSRIEKTGKTYLRYFFDRYNYLTSKYNLYILTDKIDFINQRVKDARTIYIPHIPFPLISRYIFWLMCRVRLIFIRYDLLFLWVKDSPFSLLWINKALVFYVNLEPSQALEMKDTIIKIPIFRLIYYWLVCNSLDKADKVIVPDRRLPNLADDQRINSRKIEYIPPGVDLRIFNNNKVYNKLTSIIPEEKFVLIYAGTIAENRGLNFLLRCMKEILRKNQNILLILIGDMIGRDLSMKSILERIKNMGIRNIVRVFPSVDYNLLPIYFKNADIGISYLEPTEYFKRSIPQKLFEYQAMGLPIIANNIATHNIFIKNGKNGFIINNEDEFNDAVIKLYEDKLLYREMSQNSIKFAQQYDLKIIMQKLDSIIESLVKFLY